MPLIVFIYKYFFVDFVFLCLVFFFQENTFIVLNELRIAFANIIEIQFVNRYFLASFSFILFCTTWTYRKVKLIDRNELKAEPLSIRQIFARFIIVITVFVAYSKKQTLNYSEFQVYKLTDKSGLFFELLFSWVIALIVIEILEWILSNIFNLIDKKKI